MHGTKFTSVSRRLCVHLYARVPTVQKLTTAPDATLSDNRPPVVDNRGPMGPYVVTDDPLVITVERGTFRTARARRGFRSVFLFKRPPRPHGMAEAAQKVLLGFVDEPVCLENASDDQQSYTTNKIGGLPVNKFLKFPR